MRSAAPLAEEALEGSGCALPPGCPEAALPWARLVAIAGFDGFNENGYGLLMETTLLRDAQLHCPLTAIESLLALMTTGK